LGSGRPRAAPRREHGRGVGSPKSYFCITLLGLLPRAKARRQEP